jgi:hypothetical protein
MERVGPAPRRRHPSRGRIAFAGALVTGLVAFGALGGIGEAATTAKNAYVGSKFVVFVPFGGFHDSHDDGGKPDDKQYGHHKHMCHHPGSHQETMDVSDWAVAAFLAHGDYLGRCHRYDDHDEHHGH